MNQNRISIRESMYTLSLFVLLALLGTGFLSSITVVHAQSAATCGSQESDQIENENSADDTTEPKCPKDTQLETDSTDCMVFGNAPAETTDVNATDEQADGPEIQDAVGTEVNGQEVQDQAGSGEQVGEDNAADAGKEGDPVFVGSLKVDETVFEKLPDAGRCDAMKTMAKITIGAAQTAVLKAKLGSEVVTIELDVENGYLVYSTQLKDGRDVKVDAGNGSILATQAVDTND